jgi:hypothetical protein
MTITPVFQTLHLPDARIVVLDWSNDKSYRYENLFCYNLDGSLKWKAHLPEHTGPDCFVGIRLDNRKLIANTWSCYAVWIDPATGQHLRMEFTK